jgi:hypothetical protein
VKEPSGHRGETSLEHLQEKPAFAEAESGFPSQECAEATVLRQRYAVGRQQVWE